MTIAKVRERFWILKLRRLVKRVRKSYYGCVRFRAQAYEKPPPGKLPATRTEGSAPFQVVGVDFAGPIRYRTKGKAEKKAYLVLYGYHFLVVNKIEWRFNLSRVPWWGGQYERLIGLFKRAFYKTIGNGMLTWESPSTIVL